jgi:DHA3 family tetracycline resistance protein-like MFS transporter
MKRPSAYNVYLLMEGSFSLFFAIIVAANLIYQATTVGLNPLQLVLVGTVLEATVFVCEVPTGMFADMFSRRLSIIIGYVLVGAGFMLEGFVPHFEAILLAQVLWGAGATFTSGASEAWISDEIGEAHAGPAFMRAAQVGQMTAVAGTLVGIVLGSVQINLPIIVGGALTSLLGLGLIAVMPEHGFRPRHSNGQVTNLSYEGGQVTNLPYKGGQQLRARLRDSAGMLRRRPALLTILAIAAVFGAFSEGYDRLSTAHMVEDFTFPAFADLQPIVWLGVIGIVTRFLSATVIEVVRKRVDTNNHQSVVRALSVLYAVLGASVIAFGLAGNFPLAVAALILAAIVRRTGDPIYTAWVNQRLDPQVRATVISIGSQANALGQIAGGPVVGVIGTLWSLRAALVAAGLLLSPALLLVRYTGQRHELPQLKEEVV